MTVASGTAVIFFILVALMWTLNDMYAVAILESSSRIFAGAIAAFWVNLKFKLDEPKHFEQSQPSLSTTADLTSVSTHNN